MLAGTATRTSKRIIQHPNIQRNANAGSFGVSDAVQAQHAAPQSPAGASLGNKGNLASAVSKDAQWKKRYQLQATARRLLPEHKSLQCCLRNMKRGTAHATIESNGDTAKLTGVHRCNYGYLCPVCAPKIAMQHARELAAACAAAYAKGWRVLHITYTLSHKKGESLEKVLKSITDARRKYFLAGRGFQTIKQKAGIEGSARALETTSGDNGWHPHIHELLFVSGEVYSELEADLLQRWMEAVQKVGGTSSKDHALRMEEGSQKISEYLNKFGQLPIEGGHSVEMELSHGHTKIARKSGSTPFALLEAARSGSTSAGNLFREYAECMAGRAVIRWSKGLRAVLGMQSEVSVEENTPNVEYVPVAALSKDALIEISDNCLLPAVLTAAVAGFPVLREFLSLYDIHEHPWQAGLFTVGNPEQLKRMFPT